jgi:acetyl-CoA acetyltransferase
LKSSLKLKSGDQQSVSAWIAEAARQRLRWNALGDAVVAFEAENGVLTEDELSRASDLLDRAAALRPTKKKRQSRSTNTPQMA